MTEEHLLTQLRWRYATKQFDSARKIPESTWQTLEDALVLTPSSFGLQPWKFLVVTDAALRERLLPHSFNQRQVVECSHLVVLAVKRVMSQDDIEAHVRRTAEVHVTPVESLAGFQRLLMRSIVEGMSAQQATDWAVRQAYIALGSLMTCAAVLGIDTCPMEGFVAEKYDAELGLDAEGLTTAVLCPVGYRAAHDKYAALPKVRFPREQLIRRVGP